MTEYVLKKDYESYKEKVNSKIEESEIRYATLEANLKHMQNTLNVILGALVSGVGSIIVILLTRGIK
jgi:flagellar capping protein FliD